MLRSDQQLNGARGSRLPMIGTRSVPAMKSSGNGSLNVGQRLHRLLRPANACRCCPYLGTTTAFPLTIRSESTSGSHVRRDRDGRHGQRRYQNGRAAQDRDAAGGRERRHMGAVQHDQSGGQELQARRITPWTANLNRPSLRICSATAHARWCCSSPTAANRNCPPSGASIPGSAWLRQREFVESRGLIALDGTIRIGAHICPIQSHLIDKDTDACVSDTRMD